MNILHTNIKILKSNLVYFSIIILTLLSLGCSVETNRVDEKVSETLISKNWIRDSYTNKNSDGPFEPYENKSEFQFLSHGNLLIKEPQSNNNLGSGLIPPPQGFTDTLLIHGNWAYFENSNTLTLKIDDSTSQNSIHSYINWKLSHLDEDYFEIENIESDSTEIIKVNFKSKI